MTGRTTPTDLQQTPVTANHRSEFAVDVAPKASTDQVAALPDRPRVLVSAPIFLPGVNGGGPIRSIANLIAHLEHLYAFSVMTADRDFQATDPYPDVTVNTWELQGKAQVCYLSPDHRSLNALQTLLMSTPYDVLYLNGFLEPHFTVRVLLLRRLNRLPDTPVVLAPRGELCPGVLRIGAVKKRLFISIARLLGLYRRIIWQATSPQEAEDIRRVMGAKQTVLLAPNLSAPSASLASSAAPARVKEPGNLNLVFLSRIVRKKNLTGALRALYGVHGAVTFHIYGPQEDPAYWSECEQLIAGLPGNITVQVHGAVPHEDVWRIMQEHQVFLFPTLSENFGHVILEAFLGGCLPILSDQTPWLGLREQGIGWDFPLTDVAGFRAALQECVTMDNATYQAWSARARAYGAQISTNPERVQQSDALFQSALSHVRQIQ